MPSSLGVYFGPKIIAIVETKAKKILHHLSVRRSIISESELEQKVPEEVTIAAVFNDELRKNKIEAKDATISLSGRDLIVRTFELPILPANELPAAVNFEAKKYIPFKVEELVSDFQILFDKKTRRNLVLFVGIKKEALDKHLNILRQLNIKVNNVDYSAFSLLRFLRLTGLGNKGVVGLVSADLEEESEVNFTVLDNGFPVFSRDISLSSAQPQRFEQPQETPGAGMDMEKLKTEIRVSLDYYNRKFSGKKIENIFLISDKASHLDLEAFIKDLGLSVRYLDIAVYLRGAGSSSLSFIKGYGASLFKTIKTSLKINLLAQKAKPEAGKKLSLQAETFFLFSELRQQIKIDFRVVILGLLIWAASAGYGFYRTLPVRGELNEIINARPKVASIAPAATYEELEKIDSEYKSQLNTLEGLIQKQVYFTEVMNVIVRSIQGDLWLTSISFQKDENKAELTLKGFAYLSDSEKELRLVNTFLLKLKESPDFINYFKEIEISSLEQQPFEKIMVTSFTVLCRNSK
ncbi:MAG: pilus assembly protein PilM [Candidatus Omnitrophota bacterium]|jgi:type IV pilus assembly protein PilM